MRTTLLATIALVLLLAVPARAQNSYADELITSAREKNLGWDRYWLLLLHYRKHRIWGWSSEADDPGFFFSRDGKTNPQAELEATLRAFFEPPAPDPEIQMHPQCQFPARYHWLKEQLGFDPARLPRQECPRFERWRSTLDPESATLIFAAAYLNNPASLYGHTFLRLDKKGAPPGSDLLSYIVSFSAEVTSSNSIAYAARGLFGGFKGRFSTVPYYLKVQEYTNLESRDLWEYRLNLTQDEMDRLTRHLWEMGSTYFDYWFFDENCSYHLLSLIEIARPSLHLREQYHFWTVPTDTVRSFLAEPDLVGRIHLRPSQHKKLMAQRERLSEDEQDLAADIARRNNTGRFGPLEGLSPERQAEVLDTADAYLRYRVAAGETGGEEGKKADREILLKRGKLLFPSEPVEVEEPARADQGHGTSRLGISFGSSWRSTFEEITFRPTLQDFLSDSEGYEWGSHLEMANIRLRFDNKPKRFSLEQFEFFSIISLWPVDSWSFKLSWKVSTGFNMPRELSCTTWQCLAYDLKAGGGLAYATRIWRRELYFVFAEAEAAVGHGFDDWHRIGPAAWGGVLVELAPRWRFLATGRYFYPLTGDDRDVWEVTLGSSITLAHNWELRAEGKGGTRPEEGSLGIHWYF